MRCVDTDNRVDRMDYLWLDLVVLQAPLSTNESFKVKNINGFIFSPLTCLVENTVIQWDEVSCIIQKPRFNFYIVG